MKATLPSNCVVTLVPFDAALYALRNTVERGFNRLKQWRGIATRYDCAP